jgi:hypothetical protein
VIISVEFPVGLGLFLLLVEVYSKNDFFPGPTLRTLTRSSCLFSQH